MVMQSVNDLEKMGKNSAEPPSTLEERVLVLLDAITVHLRSLEGRFELIERHLERSNSALGPVIAEAEAPSEQRRAPSFPPYALSCDGHVLLNVRALEGIDLSGREVFTGIVLSNTEAN